MTKIIEITQKPSISVENLLFLGEIKAKKIIFITDKKIWKNCAKFFSTDFLGNIQNLILKNPQADEKNLNKIILAAKKSDFIIGLGSGTINDLCKLSAAKLKIPYAIFASATSMNGYLSQNASITINGHKKTLTATLPQAVFYNLKILKSTPLNLIKAGIGDSICFYSCHFDWYLSHLLLGTKFDERPFKILEEKMNFLVKNYQKFKIKDEKFLKILLEILLLSGQGMAIAGGSYPASQSEHLIAHCLSMKYPKEMAKILHGNQIAITTLTSAKLQKKLLMQEKIFLQKTEFPLEKLTKFFGRKIALECQKEFTQKKVPLKINKWHEHKNKLQKIYLDSEVIKKIFSHFKLTTSFNFLSEEEYLEAISNAKFIRNRFTCLDMV